MYFNRCFPGVHPVVEAQRKIEEAKKNVPKPPEVPIDNPLG